jgi:SAM-dependent methyltransferase
MVAIAGFTKAQIFDAVREMYSEVATQPSRQFHFPTGCAACRFVGYPGDWLGRLPPTAVESFAGVGFPFRAGVICQGDTVLDIGAGSGTDTLLAAGLVGPSGRVIALDMTPAMVAKLSRNIAAAGVTNVEVLAGNAEAIPLPDASVDVVTSNGVLNLVPDKAKAFAEIFRVLRPGGRVQIADIMLARPAGETARGNPELWAECVVGASLEDDYLGLLRSVGFADVTVLRRYDYFSGSASPDTRRIAASLGARAAEITMQRPHTPRGGVPEWLRRLSPLAIGRRASQHGIVGLLATFGALAACYGALVLIAGLALLGVAVPLNTQVWTAAIVLLSILAPVGLGLNWRAHRRIGPLVAVAAGVLLVLYAFFRHYDWRIEAAGFAIMLGAALWDRWLYRRALGC